LNPADASIGKGQVLKASVNIGLNAVIIAVTEGMPRVLTVRAEHFLAYRSRRWRLERSPDDAPLEALPFGPFDPALDRTLELGLRRWVREQTGLDLGYVEQLYTFGDRNRDPIEREGGPRVISVAYLAFVRESKLAGTGNALWRDWYYFLPWEDWRRGRPRMIHEEILPILKRWIEAAPDSAARQERKERCDIAFGRGEAPWVPERVLERYELLYEVGLADEAARDSSQKRGGAFSRGMASGESRPSRPGLGWPMAFDYRRILATALGRLRGKVKYRPVVFELLPANFTLSQLQRVLEALAGMQLHKQNFRRLVEAGGLVEGTGRLDLRTGGRPAEIFRFRREVLRERPAPGVGFPGLGIRQG
jgi:hypothetical protein